MSKSASYPSLDNKVVVITGGASGIGAAMAQAFSLQGSQVCILDSDKESALDLRENTNHSKYRIDFHHIDITQVSRLHEILENIYGKYQRLDILVNNVANDQRHDTLSMDLANWNKNLAINLNPTFFAAQKAIELMQKQSKGVIINFSSINAYITPSNMPAYVAAKSAILGLTKALAKEFGKDEIRVNSIVPGWIATERQLNTYLTPEEEDQWEKKLALKGRIEPEEVAKLALFLASDDSAKITGQEFIIDAGRV